MEDQQSQEAAVSPDPPRERSAKPAWVIAFRFVLAASTIGAACFVTAKLAHPSRIGMSSSDAARVFAFAICVGIPSLVIAIGLLSRARWGAWLAIAFDALFVTCGVGSGLVMRLQQGGALTVFGQAVVLGLFLWEGASLLNWLTAPRRVLGRYWAVVGIVFAASFAWGLHSAWFPGRFFYSGYFSELVSYDHGDPQLSSYRLAEHSFWHSSGFARLRLIDPHDGLNRTLRRLKVSHNATRACYLVGEMGEAAALVVIDLTADRDDTKRNQRSFSLKQYHIAFGSGNLEWSPDDKTIAYAESQRLHLIDAATGKVTSVPIAADAGLTSMEKAWSAEYKPPTIDEVRERAVRAGDQPLSEHASDVVRRSAAGIRAKLGLPRDVVTVPRDWSQMYVGDFGHDGVVCSFLYSGRSISWPNAETILCDNLRLTLSRSKDGKVSAVSSETPLPSVFFARPMWSPKGDRAAYLLSIAKPGDDPWRQAAMLVIVDSAGKVLGSHRISARVGDGVRWSNDGRHVAVFVAGWDFDDHFCIYDTSTFRRLQVRPLENSDANGFGAPWDWVCP